MGAIASLAQRVVAIAPGAEASVEIKVRNTGSVVDQVSLTILGDAAAWSSAEPPTLSLFPGAEETARIVFRPPRESTVPAGAMPFGVRVASTEDPAGSVVEEGRIDIAPFSAVSAELQPRTARGSRSARYDLAVDNRGNVGLNAAIAGTDAEQALAFDIDPPAMMVEPGNASFARVGVRPRKRFWRGHPQTRPFFLQVEAPNQPPVPVEGTLLQEPMLPPWFLRALLALVALAIALLLLWFLVLRPLVLTAAEEAAEERVAQVIEDMGIQPPDPVNGGDGGDDDGGDDGSTETATPPPGGVTSTVPTDGRLRARQNIRWPDSSEPLNVTDLVFSNPLAESGALRLMRNDDVLLDLRLEHFRDLDFHFVTPIVVRPGDRLELRCDACEQPAVYYSGYLR